MPVLQAKIKPNGTVKKTLTGMHWDYGRQLEAAGVYQLTNVVEMPGGMYKADICCGGIVKERKTFFPSHWDADTLLSKLSEACHNAYKITPKSKGIIEIRGIVEEGFEIVIRLNKRGKTLTAYPDLSGKK